MPQVRAITSFIRCIFFCVSILQVQAGNCKLTLTSSTAQDGLVYAVLGQGAIRIDCQVNCGQQVDSKFYHNFNLLENPHIMVNRKSLFIHDIQKSVHGNYSCCVNIQQQTTCSNSITVLVFELPIISLMSRDKLIKPLGGSATMSANVSGDNLMWHAVWHVNGNPLWNSTVQLNFRLKQEWRVDLVIPNLQYTDQGLYRLAVTSGHTLPLYSPDKELAVQGPPEIPSGLRVLPVPAGNGTSSRLRVRWISPAPPDHLKYNTPATTFRVSYQALGHAWKEQHVRGTEVILNDIAPCTVLNVKVAGCNLIGCSQASQTVQQKTSVSHNSAWLEDNLYVDKESGKMLLRHKQEVRELCVPLSYSLKDTSQLCTHQSTNRANHPGVFAVGFMCSSGFTDLTQCSFQCPLPSRNCGSGEETVELCASHHSERSSDTAIETTIANPTSKPADNSSHSISPVTLALAVVLSVVGTVAMIGLVFYIYRRSRSREERQKSLGNVQVLSCNSSLLESNQDRSGRPNTAQSTKEDLDNNAKAGPDHDSS